MKLSKRAKAIFLILFVVIGATNRCDCDDENMEVESELDIVGTWILRSAEFETEIDLDGDGPMLPMKDIRNFLLDAFNVYANCSSIDEIPLQFSDEIASAATSADPTNRYRVYAVCPEGQGITSQIGVYYMDPYRARSFYFEIEEINDPGNLIEWEDQMFITITEDLNQDGVRIMHGNSALIHKESFSYKRFDFVFEEYTSE
jgi:hypothetical protein